MATFNSHLKLPMGIGDDEDIILYTPDIPNYMRSRWENNEKDNKKG